MGYKVAVVGATGNVGREMLAILAERSFPADDVVAIASRRSQGTEVSFGDKIIKVRAIDHHDFSDVDICLMSAGAAASKDGSPKIAAIVTDGNERVLSKIVRADAEEIDMFGDSEHAEGRGRCLNHRAKCRTLVDAKFGERCLEKCPHRLNIFFQRDHRDQHADLLFLRQP